MSSASHDVIRAAGVVLTRGVGKDLEVAVIHRRRRRDWSLPKGKIDPGEDILTCAKRELQEETGYTAREWARAGVLHPVISYSTEFIEVWFARGLTAGASRLDEGEFLEVFSAKPEQLLRWCFEGRVTDAKTLTGALWLQNVLAEPA